MSKRDNGAAGPDWIRECPRRMMVGFHIPDYDQTAEYATLVKAGKAPPILADFDARSWARALKQARVQVFYFYSKCHRGNAYYPSKAAGAHVHSALKVKGDIFGQWCEACRSEGIVPNAVYEFSDLRMPHDHPDWCHRRFLTAEERERYRHDKQVKKLVDFTDGEQGSRLMGPCLNGPYGEFAIEQAREIVRQYPVEGYYVDFLGLFAYGEWVCPYCAPRFRADLGFDFKGIAGMTRRQRMDYSRWHYAQNAAYIERMRRAINDIRPDVAFVHNFHGGYSQTGMQTWEMAHKLTSFATGDMFVLRSGQLQIDWKLRSYVAASRFKPAEVLLDTGVAVASDSHTPKALDSYRAELWTARALNVAPTASCMATITGDYVRPIFALVQEVFEEQAEYEPWLSDMQPEYTVGVLRSGQTLEKLDGDPVGDSAKTPHGLEFAGWCQALIQGHVLWDVVPDHLVKPDYLRRFRLLILPHTACLSRAQCAAIDSYLRAGGRVLATGETSLYDHDGEARKDFGLAAAFGVHWRGGCDTDMNRLVLTDGALKPREKWVSSVMSYAQGQCRVRTVRGARVLGDIYSTQAVPMAITLTPMNAPGVVRHRHGKGTALYFAGHPGLHYYLQGTDTWRRLMLAAVGNLLGRSSPVALAAPGSVGLYAHRQAGKNRLVVNLINWVPGCARTALSSNLGRTPRFDEVSVMPPAGDVVLRLKPPRGKIIRRVYRAPDRRALRMRKEGADVIVTVPDLRTHAMVVAEFGRKKQK